MHSPLVVRVARGAGLELIGNSDYQSLLEGLEGIAYATSPSGVVLGYGRGHWEEFALRNGAPELTVPGRVCGRPLSEFITGRLARTVHEAAAEAVRSRRRELVTYTYRCDAPHLRRELQMTISRLEQDGTLVALLYHSVCRKETSREPLGILERRDPSPGSPSLRICSYCKNVRYPPDGEDSFWMAPEQYYELGGSDEVVLSHGICPDCWTTIAEPLLATSREQLDRSG